MLRRLVIAGLAAALTAPLYVTSSASATVLFACKGINGVVRPTPGLSHTQTAQSANGEIAFGRNPLTECDNGEGAVIRFGEPLVNPITTDPARPIGCPVAWGGAGPDYPDRTPILLGDPVRSFKIVWPGERPTLHRRSNGVATVKAGPVGDQYRFDFSIITGEYAPPPGQKTRVRFTARIVPGFDSYTCADDTDPSENLYLEPVGPVIVTQK